MKRLFCLQAKVSRHEKEIREEYFFKNSSTENLNLVLLLLLFNDY